MPLDGILLTYETQSLLSPDVGLRAELWKVDDMRSMFSQLWQRG